MGLALRLLEALVVVLGWGLWTALSGGCVTDTISFDPRPIEPPVIVDSKTSPRRIGITFYVDRTSDKTEWPMNVVVVEKDANRPLMAHFRVVDPALPPDDAPSFEAQAIPAPGGGIQRRDLMFKVRTDLVPPASCRRLELVVSGSFDMNLDEGFFAYIPPERDQDDIAWARWGIFEGRPDRISPELAASCHADTDLITPTVTTEVVP